MLDIKPQDFDPDLVEMPLGSVIDGELVAGEGDPITVLRPSDGRSAGTVRSANESDVDRAVASARRAFAESGWAQCAPRERGAVLRRWAQLIDDNAERLAQIEAAVSSRPISECLGRDIPATADMIRYYGEWTDKLTGDTFSSSADIFSATLREPFGVVAAISPWNVPLLLAAVKFAPALAAGNAVVLKPAELTPFSAVAFAQLAVRAGLPRGLFNVLIGSGPVAGSALVKHRDVDFVAFTGSTATGQRIMSDCAQAGPKPVSLELGGKSPQVVFADVPDMARVADTIALGMTRNSGQLCFCGSRLVVQRSIADKLLAMIEDRLAGVRRGPTWSAQTRLPPIISAAQADRIEAILARSEAAAARTLRGGQRLKEGGGTYFEPAIVMDVGKTDALFSEEVFGPVLAVQRFDSFEEAMELADHPEYGLTASVHTSRLDEAMRAARLLPAGTIWINSFGRGSDVSSPFGGFKRSGFGKEFGREGYEKYLKTKAVWIQGSELV